MPTNSIILSFICIISRVLVDCFVTSVEYILSLVTKPWPSCIILSLCECATLSVLGSYNLSSTWYSMLYGVWIIALLSSLVLVCCWGSDIHAPCLVFHCERMVKKQTIGLVSRMLHLAFLCCHVLCSTRFMFFIGCMLLCLCALCGRVVCGSSHWPFVLMLCFVLVLSLRSVVALVLIGRVFSFYVLWTHGFCVCFYVPCVLLSIV